MNNKIPSIVIIAFVLALILPIVGLILGIIALNKVNKTEEKTGKGLAIASIVIGAILTIPAFLIFVGAIAYFGVMSPSVYIPSESQTSASESSTSPSESHTPTSESHTSSGELYSFFVQRCSTGTGFNCEIKSIGSNNIDLELENVSPVGIKIVISEARILYEDIVCIDSSERIVDNNEKVIFNIGNCDLSDLPNRVMFDIEIDYYPEEAGEQFKTTANGNFIAQIN